MSKLRSINTAIWNDVWFENLSTEKKLLFIYLITNEKTNMLGVYEISIRKISFDTGINSERVSKALKEFEKDCKIRYKCDCIILLNYLKHQNYNFNMKKSAIDCYNELKPALKIENQPFIDRTEKGFETLCKGFGMVRKEEIEIEEEYEEEIEIEFTDIFDFWNSLNIKNHKEFKHKKEIKKAIELTSIDEVKESMKNYKEVLTSDFYFNHTWALIDFLKLQKGKTEYNFKRFLKGGDIWENYLIDKNKPKKNQPNYDLPKVSSYAEELKKQLNL